MVDRRSALQVSNFEAAGRARTLKLHAPTQVECDESGAFGEWFKRPWGEQWAKGQEVSVNLHWWSRRSALQVGDSQNHAPVICIGLKKLPLQLSTRRFLQFARAFSVPVRVGIVEVSAEVSGGSS